LLTTQLELVLITFNRSAELRHTLTRLAESPFARCRLTVLDNCSTDETPKVCAELRPRFDDFHVVRHHRNIGGGANTLRAVETARAPYTWILCDDDDFDFSDCSDVIEALEAGDVDLICVGGPGREDWPPGRSTLGELAAGGKRVFYVLTFIPSTIFRSELFDESALTKGYRAIDDLYPNFEFVRRQVERSASVHVSKRLIVLRRGVAVPGSALYWLLRWVRCASTIQSRSLRQATVYSTTPRRRHWLVVLASAIAQERLYFPRRTTAELLELGTLLRGEQRLALVLFAPLAFVPAAAYERVKVLFKRVRGESLQDGPPDFTHSLEARP
jgi:glycosyltransferase involved in cell wall biosynthesis